MSIVVAATTGGGMTLAECSTMAVLFSRHDACCCGVTNVESEANSYIRAS